MAKKDNVKINEVGDAIDRAKSDPKSKQPRFYTSEDSEQIFLSIRRLTEYTDLNAPPYKPNSMVRDRWLNDFWRQEPHLAGVISQVVSIDQNRGWQLVGGRNQVATYREVFHQFNQGAGWRYSTGQLSESYYTTDLGGIVEIGRDGDSGPLRALWTVDSTRCYLTGDYDFPLKYNPLKGKPQKWPQDDFFRVVSMPNISERYNGLGYSALGRALELAKIMIAIYRHDQESLGARAPRGLLLLQNISEEQWRTALQARDQEVGSLAAKYFGGVMVLASEGIQQIDAKLVALSKLPENFDMETTVNMIMYAYALCFGYDATEFWPVRSGAIGRGNETTIQHNKATGKGAINFTLHLQEQLQGLLPKTVDFTFDERDAQGELVDAELNQAYSKVATELYTAGLKDGQPLLSREEARSLLADYGIIDSAWTELDEREVVTDISRAHNRLETIRQRCLESERVIRAINKFPDEPIVLYHYKPDMLKPKGRESVTVLWERGSEAYQKYHMLNRAVLPTVVIETPMSRQRNG